MTSPRPGVILYCFNLDQMVAFYSTCFDGSEVARAESFRSLHLGTLTLHLIQSDEAKPDGQPRTETPLKLSLPVGDLDLASERVRAGGGQLRGERWRWELDEHQDVIDPEDNVLEMFRRDVE